MSPLSEKLQVKSKLLYHTPQYPKDHFVQITIKEVIKSGSIGKNDYKKIGEVLKNICDALLTNKGKKI